MAVEPTITGYGPLAPSMVLDSSELSWPPTITSTPVVFCSRGTPFKESLEYRARIVERLGLTHVSVVEGHEPQARRGDYDHCEKMWVEYEHGPGRSHEICHLNDTLAPYDCWVSAVYHARRPEDARPRVDAEGRLIRIDPLAGWSREDVREYMRAHDLPAHARAYRRNLRMPRRDDDAPVETFHF